MCSKGKKIIGRSGVRALSLGSSADVKEHKESKALVCVLDTGDVWR